MRCRLVLLALGGKPRIAHHPISMAPKCRKCGAPCQKYGGVGGYSVQCQSCNIEQSAKRCSAYARRTEAQGVTQTSSHTLSQSQAILAYLEAGNTLTPLEALQRFGCLALHSRAAELREHGHVIDCQLIKLPNGKRVGQYSIIHIPYG